MKGSFIDKKIIFTDYTDYQLDKLRRLLTWEDERSKIKDTLLNEEQPCEVSIPWGLYDIIKNIIPLELENHFDHGQDFEKIDVEGDLLNGITLYDFQKFAISKSINRKFGSILIPTGGGKSEVILGILKKLDQTNKIKQALIIAPTVGLMQQFYQRAIDRGFSKKDLGLYYGLRKDTNAKIVVGVVNSIYEGIKYTDYDVIKLLNNSNILIFDECHHIKANSWFTIANYSNKEYLLGVSGSLYNNNEDILERYSDALLYGYFGKPIFSISSRYLRNLGLIAQPYIYFVPTGSFTAKYKGRYNNIYDKFIVDNIPRNEQIISYTKKFIQYGLPTLIIVQRKSHGIKLLEMLNDNKSICIYGGNVGFVKDCGGVETIKIDYDIFRQEFNNGQWDVAILSQVGDEGLDLPNVGALIMGGAGRSRIKILQRLGRALRKKSRKYNRAYILDFTDRHHVYLLAQSNRRKKIYLDEGAIILDNPYKLMNEICIDLGIE